MQGWLARLRAHAGSLRYGFLMLPLLVAGAFVVLAIGLVWFDRHGGRHGLGGFSADAQAARQVLSTIAGSLITVAGLTFSITIVTLQLVSQQFSPRTLRNFLGDRLTQFVAGAFVGVFLYCLFVLRAVRTIGNDGKTGFVPGLAVTIAVVLAVAALVLLLVFIDRMANSIQVSTIAGRIAHTTLGALAGLYPAPFGQAAGRDADEVVRSWRTRGDPHDVHAERPGYVQALALEALARGLGSPGLRLHVRIEPGDFVTTSDVLVRVWGATDPEAVTRHIRRTIAVGDERDLVHDLGYGIRQLTDIAVKALSPGVNDPTTAVTCLGYLRAILEQLAARRFPDEVREEPERDLVVVARRRPFEEFVRASLVELGRHAAGDPSVALALLDAYASVARAACAAGAGERAELLVAAAEDLAAQALEQVRVATDDRLLAAALERARAAGRGAGA